MEDYTRAQALMDEQLRSDWPKELGAIAQQLNPLHGKMFDGVAADYYWSVIESEWATDVGFRGGVELRRLFPLLVEHGMTSFSSPDVMTSSSGAKCSASKCYDLPAGRKHALARIWPVSR
jgi:hypothetical protein